MPATPEIGQIVNVRARQYLVESVTPPIHPQGDTLVSLACLNDDAQGQVLEVFWAREIDAEILGNSTWEQVAQRGFDRPHYFSAYLHTLRWNCVTSTDPKLFQAPYRAGIEVKAYQLEPLRKALLMPRVSLFIADDVGLGKTIEAGLILREMIMRQKIRRVVIACPPSVVRQWQEEMESRFGLLFQVVDREFFASKRRERGYGVNPWDTHNRFIISHALIRDEAYAAPLRIWLEEFAPGSMLILDEAHNAAPASGSRYAIDSQLTKTMRELAPRFEHKLFLSATPHNGHSNSFTALLEILDPQRFCRGVFEPEKHQKALETVMVRRLKQDLRDTGDRDFPQRKIIPISIEGLPVDAPELVLAQLLQQYRTCREQRLKDAPKSTQNTAKLVITSLQKRLLSSIEAFARTLKVHRASIERQVEKQRQSDIQEFPLLYQSIGSDDDRAELSEAEVQAEEDAQMTRATKQTNREIGAEELALLAEMGNIAQNARHQADAKVQHLVAWIKEYMCPKLGQPQAVWNDRRLLIFTEYLDTKSYLERQLTQAIGNTNQRLGFFHGGMGEERRQQIKTAFNADPHTHPLRILIATDAAREGINLQNYCADLFHFDIPWNPSRMEQRNGRIDRKLQREAEVRCHYFILKQRAEDRVLDVLVKKTATIQRELGSLSPVLERQVAKLLDTGIYSQQEAQLTAQIEDIDSKLAGKSDELLVERRVNIQEQLEIARPPQQKLLTELAQLDRMLKDSQEWLGLDDRLFRDALSVSLEIMGAPSLVPLEANAALKDEDRAQWIVPQRDSQTTDPAWAATLDSLRAVRKPGQKLWDWRNEAPVRPVVFRDPGSLDGEVVHLHLEHRLVQRLLGRFLAQGFVHNELTRACVCLTDDPLPKVIVLGRLSLYGARASRLHDEIVAVAAEWIEPDLRGKGKLKALGESDKENVLATLEQSLANPRLRDVSIGIQERLRSFAAQDVLELLPNLEKRAATLVERATKKLTERGVREAAEMKQLLIDLQKSILAKEKQDGSRQLDLFGDDLRQLELDRKHWKKRIDEIDSEINTEPQRIEEIYQVKANRIEPVGLVYLWPVSK